jgi:DNA polymerase-3 subunit beta
LVPKSFLGDVSFDRADMISALDRVMVVLSKSSVLKLSIGPGKIIVKAEAAEVGSAAENVEAEYDGKPLDVAFNGDYLLDALKTIKTDAVQLSFNTATSPVIIAGVESDGARHLLMPVQIRE